MKTAKRITVALLAFAMLACLLAGCGAKTIIGAWTTSYEESGVSYDITMEFKDDGKMTFDMGLGDSYIITADYEVDGENLTITYEGEDPIKNTFKIDGDILTVTDDEGVVTTLTRAVD